MEYRIFINDTEYDKSNIISMFTNSALLPDSSFGVGTVYSKSLNLTLSPKETIPHGAMIRIEIYNNGWISRGRFYIQRRKTTHKLVSLECYDDVLKMEQPFIQTHDVPDFPMLMTQAMDIICERLGLVLDAEINPIYNIEYTNEMTMRDVVRNIASAHGSNVYIEGYNRLRFVGLADIGRTFDIGKDAQSYAAINDIFTISRFTMFYSDDDESYYTAGDDSGREITVFNEWATQEIVNDVFAKIGGYTNKPFTATNAVIDPSFMLGDNVIIDGNTFKIMTAKERYSNTVTYDITSPGEDIIDNEYPYMGTYEKAMRQRLIIGRPYYGVTISRQKGLEILRSDGISRTMINSDIWEAEFDGIKRLYFDMELGQFIFNGKLGADVVIAQDVIVQNFYAENGLVANLTVDALRTDYERAWNYLNNNTNPIHYITIDNEEYKMITAETDGTESEQFRNANGELLWWRDSVVGSTMTTDETDEPVIVFVYNELIKYENSFTTVTTGIGTTVTPLMKFGAGVGVGDNGKLFIWKAGTSAHIRYITSTGVETELRAEDDGKWYYNDKEINTGTDIIKSEGKYLPAIPSGGVGKITIPNTAGAYVSLPGKVGTFTGSFQIDFHLDLTTLSVGSGAEIPLIGRYTPDGLNRWEIAFLYSTTSQCVLRHRVNGGLVNSFAFMQNPVSANRPYFRMVFDGSRATLYTSADGQSYTQQSFTSHENLSAAFSLAGSAPLYLGRNAVREYPTSPLTFFSLSVQGSAAGNVSYTFRNAGTDKPVLSIPAGSDGTSYGGTIQQASGGSDRFLVQTDTSFEYTHGRFIRIYPTETGASIPSLISINGDDYKEITENVLLTHGNFYELIWDETINKFVVSGIGLSGMDIHIDSLPTQQSEIDLFPDNSTVHVYDPNNPFIPAS